MTRSWFLVTVVTILSAGCNVDVTQPGPRTVATPVSSEEEAPKKPGEELVGDWRLQSRDGKASCTIKLQPLQGYGYGQVWTNNCRFADVPAIKTWRIDGGRLTLLGSHGRDAVGELFRYDSDGFEGALLSGEGVGLNR
ncbi:MAG: AprI/Inh family metalloprotease inhibitor [Pseudomonadota bacterium]